MRAVFQRVASAEVRSDGRATGRIGPGAVILLGVGRTDTAADAAKLADKVAKLRANGVLPEGVKVEATGNAKNNKETAGYMATTLLLAVCFIYFVLASQFESFKLPITIMLTLPLSMVGMVLIFPLLGHASWRAYEDLVK